MKFVELFNFKFKCINNVFCIYLLYIYLLNMNNGVGMIYIYIIVSLLLYIFMKYFNLYLIKVGFMLF